MSAILAITVPFFALVLTGFGAARFNLFGPSGVLGLNRFVYFFALPALLFRQTATASFDQIVGQGPFLVAHASAGLALFALAWISTRKLFAATPGQASILALGASYGNIGFMGIPLLVAALGPAAAVPLALMLLIDIAFFIPVATTIIDLTRPGDEPSHLGKSLATSVVKNPLIVAIALGLTIAALGWDLPHMVDRFAQLLGQAAAPAAMFALGAVLAGRPVSEGLAEATFVTVLKLAVHPMIMWWMMTAFGVSAQWRLVATLGAAMPVAAALFVIAQEYNTLPARASTAVLISTGASLVTLTLLIGWLS